MAGQTRTRARLLATVGDQEVYLLDANAQLVPMPRWLLAGCATEATQPISERLELVHPEDRAVPAEMFLTALKSPGRPIDGTYRMRSADRWYRRSARMLNLLGSDLVDAVLVMGRNGEELERVATEEVSSNLSGDFKPAHWMVEVLDDRARILEIDGMVEEIVGRPASDLVGESATQFVAPDSMASAAAMWAALTTQAGTTTAARQRVVRPDGSTLWVESFLVSLRQSDGSLQVLNFIHDITEQQKQELALAQLAEEFRSVAEHVPAAIFRCERDGRITFHNQLWESVLPRDCAARYLHDVVHPADRAELRAELERLHLLDGAAERFARLELRGAAGETMLALTLRAVGQAGSRIVSFVGSLEDITATMMLRRRANHDALTGLLNRDALESHLAACIEEAPDDFAVAFVDLDGFKQVNDRFGHDTGDFVLARIAERLRRAFRASDVIGRYGGDEFVIVSNVSSTGEDAAIGRRIERIFRDPIVWDDGHWQPAGSIGIARPAPGDDVRTVIRRADRAMYLTKAHRRLATG
jgi:diguanylate cyclase (GGDEF)-like protein/PAS domain S-box-containing protein